MCPLQKQNRSVSVRVFKYRPEPNKQLSINLLRYRTRGGKWPDSYKLFANPLEPLSWWHITINLKLFVARMERTIVLFPSN